jgi:hypothetical protein
MKRNSIHFRAGGQTESLHPSTRKPGHKNRAKFVCGQQDNYRTNFDDFRAVYLFGIQMDIKLYSRTSNQVFLNT